MPKWALDIVSDIFLNSTLAEETDRERGPILQTQYEDTPVRHVGDVFEMLLYGDHPLGRDIWDTGEYQGFQGNFHIPTAPMASNAVVGVAGI